jgi:opacity protein-like surface antigen
VHHSLKLIVRNNQELATMVAEKKVSEEGSSVQLSKYLFFIILLSASQWVTAAEPQFGSDHETRYARNLVPRQGKALVYIYQRAQDGVGPSPTIWLNNYEIGRIVPGSFTVWQLAPGRLGLRVDGVEPVSLSLISQAGKVYLFRLSVTQTQAGPKAQLESLPSSYRSDLAATRFIKNPLQVTPTLVQAPAPAKPVTPPPAVATVAKPKPEVKTKPASPPRSEPVPSWQAGDVGLQLKLGSLSLSQQNQNILSSDRTFDKSASSPYGVEVYYQFDDGLVTGGELLGYKAHFTTTGLSDTHDVSVLMLLADVKQYYSTDSRLQPYLGAGIGVATTSVSGPTISGNTSGLAYQIEAGLEYRLASFGIFGEAKYLGAKTKSSNDQTVDVSTTGFFAGIAFHF